MLRKFILIGGATLVVGFTLYFTILYYATYSEGTRTGELIKFSHKGYVFKTWEGEISKGLYSNKIFAFSVLDRDEATIQKLRALEGRYVRITYAQRYKTFPWWGDNVYFVTDVTEVKPPVMAR